MLKTDQKRRTNMAYAIIASKPGGTEVLRKINIDITLNQHYYCSRLHHYDANYLNR